MDTNRDVVYIVDDDTDVRQSLAAALTAAGYTVEAYSRADEFLANDCGNEPHCLVVDLLMPGMTGLQLCQEIVSRKAGWSFVMVSGSADVATAVEVMRLGAVDFLEKPFRWPRLLEAVGRANQKVRSGRKARLAEIDCAARLSQLTPRERQILDSLANGQVTKEIAAHLGISTRTVDVHRSRIMQKLGIESPLQLANILAILARAAA